MLKIFSKETSSTRKQKLSKNIMLQHMLPLTTKVMEQRINSTALCCLTIFPVPTIKNVQMQEFTHKELIIIIIIMLLTWIPLTPSRYLSLSSISPGRSSRLYPVLGLAGCSTFAHPFEGVHDSILLINSSLLLQQCLACLVRLTWIVFMMSGRWPYSCCFVGCCPHDLFNTACSILV